METGSKPILRKQAFTAAVRRFPDAEFAIRKLMIDSETFRDICEELAEAEWALTSVAETPAALSQARKIEWQELIDRLAAELATVLREGTGGLSRRGNR
jgi:FlaA1/EpsC-like NDP-sugar epimerase